MRLIIVKTKLKRNTVTALWHTVTFLWHTMWHIFLSLSSKVRIYFIYLLYILLRHLPEKTPPLRSVSVYVRVRVYVCTRGAFSEKCLRGGIVIRSDTLWPAQELREDMSQGMSLLWHSGALVTQKNPPGHNNQVGNISIKIFLVIVHSRSEERRVGKECRSRWSPYH